MRKNADGSWTGSFRFDPVTGQAVNTAIETEEQRLLDEDAEHGYERTAQQRKADAVAAVTTRGAARNPDSSVATPLVHIVIGEKTAEQMVEAAPAAAKRRSRSTRTTPTIAASSPTALPSIPTSPWRFWRSPTSNGSFSSPHRGSSTSAEAHGPSLETSRWRSSSPLAVDADHPDVMLRSVGYKPITFMRGQITSPPQPKTAKPNVAPTTDSRVPASSFAPTRPVRPD